jgi:hypothetical protein
MKVMSIAIVMVGQEKFSREQKMGLRCEVGKIFGTLRV